MTQFTELLTPFNKHFYMDGGIKKGSMSPVIIFKSRLTDEIYEFDIPRTDMEDYEHGKESKKINQMVSELKSIIREEKINKII